MTSSPGGLRRRAGTLGGRIYGSDLKPPVALGLTKGATSGSGIYTNKIEDYVNNLRLFVDGYTVQRPTAQVRSDTEVIQFPGPTTQVTSSRATRRLVTSIRRRQAGRSIAPVLKRGFPDPQMAQFTTVTPASTLATACAGKPPTLARLGFSLDPWGRAGFHCRPAYGSRYNVRTVGFALNLVGSGIRNCQIGC